MRVTSLIRVAFSSCVLLALPGCLHVGPKYHAPKPWSPAHFENLHSGNAFSMTEETQISVQWWKTFNDPELTSLEERVATKNLSFLLALANLSESRAQLMLAGAERFPALSATGSYRRAQRSEKLMQETLHRIGGGIVHGTHGQMGELASGFIEEAGNTATVPLLNQWSSSVDATYEIDLWGRVAHQYQAAKAGLQATEEERHAVLIAEEADMARGYLTLRGDQRRLLIMKEGVKVIQKISDIAEGRYKGGLVSAVDYEAAQARLNDTQAQIAEMNIKIAQEENALALLLGEMPGSLNEELEKNVITPVVPPVVPVGLPSELAHRRPDIREAEAKLRFAVEETGEAVADFYPRVTINADFGFQTLSFRDLGFWNAKAWNVGPSISLPIFQGGRLSGQLALKKGAQKAAAISYKQTVLQAWHDVDNALTAYHEEQTRMQKLRDEIANDNHALKLAESQYRSGLTNYLTVLSTEDQLLTAELALAENEATVATSLARLYNALGGGWENEAQAE
ncbi:efflux transporter outer membrane subunit [Acetobacter aceti]|uniref:efflux transporter outer membrane subunit n=1 Tax=Acetobacter aceti TaxID=435 RepID=UPI000C07B0BB|nr:efflux transporter outer membrane subunit [Acetobacter aceti]